MATVSGCLSFCVHPCLAYRSKVSMTSRYRRSLNLSQTLLTVGLQHCNFRNSEIPLKSCAKKLKATKDDNEKTEATSSSISSTENPMASKPKGKEQIEKGQTTAIFTGAIAITLGIGYLILVQLLDTRGIMLEPPPPEALDP
eukprot:TRINITY_DN1058_c0_g1_i1.p1 TRINITY_DN1058_c0_g1~~TRINITY_DN1058_c0_g1_i1.p1  ORF type:complete len:142 (+),score=20.15 TRINITY_DN1058_c0_g1_i1:149-574(+)